ncbi:DUF4232 domain-containing protein [Microterricola viridarii]|uniref:DUF4232 domain-containing protein n=1 Tax=Microterricola viridarii TaxID=412690 RepID=A0A1H1TXH4_9MICO|nr:DUF4232 domain-containing protein [Microterricola viridarii]SDS64666.1 Protein of unknown function [Microterricola viridarii]
MPRRPAPLTALLVALLWVASDAVAQLGLATSDLVLRTLVRAVAPDTMTVAVAAPWPQGALAGAVWAAAVACAYLLVQGLLHPDRSRSGFAAGWFAVIAAGALVQGVLAVGLAAMGWLDPSARAAFSVEPVQAAAYWGLVWGWLPALLHARLQARRPRAARRPATAAVAAPAVAVALALVALLALVPAGEDAWHRALAAEEPAPEPVPTGTPVPEIAPGEWQLDPEWCTENQLSLAASEPDAAAGSRGMSVVATNVSQAPCVLDGYPDVAFSDQETGLVDVRIQHGSSMGGTDVGPVRLLLGPEEQAVASIAWRAMPTDGLATADWLHLAPYHGGLREMLAFCSDVTGGEVVVGAWRSAT